MIDNRALCEALKTFAAERDWEQFHTPKNLAASISIEAAELLELFQWSRGQQWNEFQDAKLKSRAAEELADILLYLIRFADLAGIDLEQAARQKLLANADKYPAGQFRGSDRKYNEP
ncbi:nucleotide pyrophosphohydrolase [Undibacterium sp.]|jgi:dCTP diphosphatase|uniref:nucleotide pyrophosphohydrolase n=1 Tax=Undibacterium sp. TaxID=1914977 RepID=UPI002C8B40C7|nr:nucleotide pyrophosphohydrolase [Undibacterium sp.]HTD07210.1 nucleotide pyrophosphohydrolase [Undibacterium sp.]